MDRHPLDSKLIYTGPSKAGWHFHSVVLSCLQLAAYKFLLQLKEKRSPALVRGTLFHVGRAHYYWRLHLIQQGREKELREWYTPVEAVTKFAFLEDEGAQPGDALYTDILPAVIDALTAFDRFFQGMPWNIVLVEHVLEAEYEVDGVQHPYTARVDLAVRDRNTGLFVIVDHKTAARRSPKTDRGYMRSGQIQGLRLFGEKIYGSDFGGVQILYTEFAGDTPKYSLLGPDLTPWRGSDFVLSLKWARKSWTWWVESGADPWHFPKVNSDNGACEHRYGECAFAKLCDRGPGSGVTVGLRDE